MKPEIKLKSRGSIDNRLVQLEDNPLKFKLKTKHNYRIGFENDSKEECTFIDPSGGPFIAVGSKIEGHTVKAIYKDGTVEFEA